MRRVGIFTTVATLISATILCTSVGSALTPKLTVSPVTYPENLYTAETRTNIARYHKVWRLVRDNYYSKDKLTDWERWEHPFDAGLTNQNITRLAIQFMLNALGDDFTYLKLPEETRMADALYDATGCVTSKMLQDHIAYIKIDSFKCKSVVSEVESALTRLSRADSVVLDLRNNPGGFVPLAFQTFSLLADRSKFVSYTSRKGDEFVSTDLVLTKKGRMVVNNALAKVSARKPNLIKDKRLVVLVNGETRSAAEMLAGALRDANIATLVGTQTFGKGVLQETFELDDGSSVKVVTAKYFLPSGECINGKGITPATIAADNGSDCTDSQLLQALEVAEGGTKVAASKHRSTL